MGKRMNSVATPIAGVMRIETYPHSDARGAFARFFCEKSLADLLGGRRVVQINHSRSVERGTIRGMHFQHAPYAEVKFVRCLRGRVWDVAVDLRAGSPTFLKWHAEELSSENAHMLVIPEGCAHGFQTLEPDTELLYLHTAAYTPSAEGGVRHDDPVIAIRWPLPATNISPRDEAHAWITADFAGLRP